MSSDESSSCGPDSSSGPPVTTKTSGSGSGRHRIVDFPESSDQTEVTIYAEVVSRRTDTLRLTREGHYTVELRNKMEGSWDSFYMGVTHIRVGAEIEVTHPGPRTEDSGPSGKELAPSPAGDGISASFLSGSAPRSPRMQMGGSFVDESDVGPPRCSGEPPWDPKVPQKRTLYVRSGSTKTTSFYALEGAKFTLNSYSSMALGIGIEGECRLFFCGRPRPLPVIPSLPLPHKKATILALDGGGILGISSLRILERLEKELQKEMGSDDARLVDCFDMICGTSTGGIMALGLLDGKSVAEMTKLWGSVADHIFDGNRTIFTGLFFEGYDITRMKSVLRSNFGDKFMDTTGHPFCFVTATDVKHQPYQLFLLRNYQPKHVVRHEYRGTSRFPVWAAAWATSAAPTYLKGPSAEELESMGLFMEPQVHLVDGAMKANNPTFVALEECSRLVNKSLSNFIEDDLELLVSVGTGQPPIRLTQGDNQSKASTLQIVMNSGHLLTSATTVHREVLHWLADQDNVYFRFNAPGLGDIALDSKDKKDIDLIHKATIEYVADEKFYDVKRVARKLASRLYFKQALRRPT